MSNIDQKICSALIKLNKLTRSCKYEELRSNYLKKFLDISDHLEMLKHINSRFYNDWTPLETASRSGDIEFVSLLIEASARINDYDHIYLNHLYLAVVNGHTEVVKLLLDNGCIYFRPKHRNATLLHEACCRGHIEIVKLLISRNVNINIINCYNETAIQIAINKDHKNIIEFINNSNLSNVLL